MKRILSVFLAVALVLGIAIVPMLAFAEAEVEFAVTVDNPTPQVGDEINVTVAFTKCPANVNVLELVIPIDTEAFEVVGTAPTYDLQKNDNTAGDASFKNENSEVFVNFVDVAEPLKEGSSTITTFKLKVLAAGTIAISPESFVVTEENGESRDLTWDATDAEVTLFVEETEKPTEEPEETMPPLDEYDAVISVTSDKKAAQVGDIITVTVAFEKCAPNINTLELLIPIDTNAFEAVETPVYELKKNTNTTGGAAFRNEGAEAFINFVDVEEPLAADSVKIMTFKLKVKDAGKIAISTADSFLVDEVTGEDIPFATMSARIKIGTEEDPTVTPTLTPEETMPPLDEYDVVFEVKASKNPVQAGETITVTVEFVKCAPNINTLELVVPIDTDAFEAVGTAPKYELIKNSGTTGGTAFKDGGAKAFINFVDVEQPIAADSVKIMSFDLKVKKAGQVTVGSDTFLVDETAGKDLTWAVKGLNINVGSGEVVQPTGTPTAVPENTPTIEPTATPTVAPTATPTVAPTATPTVEPTATPTVAPTATPTVAPTATPTVEPTATPTAAPTEVPTVEPTTRPTAAPTTSPDTPKTGTAKMTVVFASVLVLAAVVMTTGVLVKKED
ncbi:MAG: hypothetical protein IJF80_06135 [Clostridia bacterium]|nr:hypothetical protein [Clostridia bacterium]